MWDTFTRVADQILPIGQDGDQSPKLLPKVRTNFVPIFDRGCRAIPSDQRLEPIPPHHQLTTEVGMNPTSAVLLGSTGSAPIHHPDSGSLITSEVKVPTVGASRPSPTASSTMTCPDALIQEDLQACTYSSNDHLASSSDTGNYETAKLAATSPRDKLRISSDTNGSDSLLGASDSTRKTVAGVKATRVHTTTMSSGQPTRSASKKTNLKEARSARAIGANGLKPRITKSTELENSTATKPLMSVPSKHRPKSTLQPDPDTVPHIAQTALVSDDKALGRTISRRPRSWQNSSSADYAAPGAMTTSSSTTGEKQPGQVGLRPNPRHGRILEEPVDRDLGIAKHSSQVNERFLARLTRPTQASTSKTTEKTQSTPPKKRPPKNISRSNPQGLSRSRKPAGAYRY
ncbi:hypothetical protein CDD80_975 [Ophiocordyceps camponoti-rufipedis]|uniref:Uncharacterized protein n=1 Tax=Ophiocordyceps camponoti-rufipedis TaxID=2004952 RepID=A0A2C5YG95_9HYPO|nr:hypothetical protein CDD80_975 [Ophiocordyceps camponoti-rufipedis]